MNSKSIRFITVLSIILALGILSYQWLWLNKSFKIAEEDFDTRVRYALKDVGENLYRSNYKEYIAQPNIVKKMNDGYFIVRVDSKIDYASTLKELLIRELNNQNLKTVFEYGIYDCENDNMKKGMRIDITGATEKVYNNATAFPKVKEESYNYYFGVNFPEKSKFIKGKLNYLYASFGLLILLLLWFGYLIITLFKQKRLREIQRDFVNNMTHEFKTPLSTIMLASDVLRNPKIVNNPERLFTYATTIHNECTHLSTQVDRVLQMANTESGKILLNKAEFDLIQLVNEIMSKYKFLIRTKGGEVNTEMPDSLIITADKLHIRNLITNLIDNAYKYRSDEREVVVHLEISTTGNQVNIKVSDNGIGIPEKYINTVFDRFFRVPTGNVHNVKGFGLGLSYVKLIAKKHGGDAFCKSILGKGSEFTIFIPKS
jgi:two-component system phosphate regulon sensor histidine kinase PhoR